jgi:hypothetical protein
VKPQVLILQLIPVPTATALKPNRCLALPFFHAFTGCDTVPAFVGNGKKSAWDTWLSFPDATSVFKQLSSQPADVGPAYRNLRDLLCCCIIVLAIK